MPIAVFCIGLLLRQLFVIAKVQKRIGKRTKHIIFFVFCQIFFLLMNLYHFPFTFSKIYNISGNIDKLHIGRLGRLRIQQCVKIA